MKEHLPLTLEREAVMPNGKIHLETVEKIAKQYIQVVFMAPAI